METSSLWYMLHIQHKISDMEQKERIRQKEIKENRSNSRLRRYISQKEYNEIKKECLMLAGQYTTTKELRQAIISKRGHAPCIDWFYRKLKKNKRK